MNHAQANINLGHGVNTRRSWTTQEEEVLLASLKELVVKGWKSDNGVKATYLNKLEEAMLKHFPGSDIKANPHIKSRITTWKKNYGSIVAILNCSGVGFNLHGDHKIECDNEKWEEICRIDLNAKNVRGRSWPLLEGWKEVFGKDRATGENAEDVIDAVNNLFQEESIATAVNATESNKPGSEENSMKEQTENSSCHSSQRLHPTSHRHKRSKTNDSSLRMCELLSEIHQDTNARLKSLAERVGYQADLGNARKQVNEWLKVIPELPIEARFEVGEILVDKPERLEYFMGLSPEERPAYVMRLLRTKGM